MNAYLRTRIFVGGVLSPSATASLPCAPAPGPPGGCPLGARLAGWWGFGRPWGVRPSGVGAGGAVVHPGRSGPAGSLSRRKFELGATAPGAVREALFSILAAYSPSRRRRSASESSGRLSTAVRMSRLGPRRGAPARVVSAGGAVVSTALRRPTQLKRHTRARARAPRLTVRAHL